MSKQKQKFKLDLKGILTLIVLAAALVLGVFNGWQDAGDKGAATVPAQVQEVADYIFEHGELPERFITKREAEKLGWDSSENYVSDVAPGKAIGGDFGTFFEQEQFTAQDRYTRDFGLWLEDETKVHPSNVEAAYMGYQILEAIYVSALEHRRVDLPMPLPLPYDCLDKLNETLPPVPYRRMPE